MNLEVHELISENTHTGQRERGGVAAVDEDAATARRAEPRDAGHDGGLACFEQQFLAVSKNARGRSDCCGSPPTALLYSEHISAHHKAALPFRVR